jgi:hypothetical protein
MPTLCRCLTGTAIDTSRTDRNARAAMHSNPARHRRLCLPVASDRYPDRPPRPLEWRSRRARRTPNLSTLAQPNPRIPIGLGPDTAGSFLGDFRTPGGVRNSSRKETGSSGASRVKKLPFVRPQLLTAFDSDRPLSLGCSGSPKGTSTPTSVPAAVRLLVSWPGERQCIRPRSTRGGLTNPTHRNALLEDTLSRSASC